MKIKYLRHGWLKLCVNYRTHECMFLAEEQELEIQRLEEERRTTAQHHEHKLKARLLTALILTMKQNFQKKLNFIMIYISI